MRKKLLSNITGSKVQLKFESISFTFCLRKTVKREAERRLRIKFQ